MKLPLDGNTVNQIRETPLEDLKINLKNNQILEIQGNIIRIS